MLVNIMVPTANSNPEVFNAVVPGVSITRIPLIRSLDSPRLIHSHTYYRTDIRRAVYTLRDGRDVLVSFYHYLITRRGLNMSFEEWFLRYESGEWGHRWERNVGSWLVEGQRVLGDDMLLVHFEKMKAKPVETLVRVCRHLDIQTQLENVESAVAQASLDRVQEIECQRTADERQDNALFNRGGKSGQWKEYFTPEIEARFWRDGGESMKLAGYADDD